MRISILISLISFSCFGQFSSLNTVVENQNILKVSILNDGSTNEIAKFNKLELGVELPESTLKAVNAFLNKEKVPGNQKLNPFLEWQLDVEAHFTHEASGEKQRVEGFYYADYTINQKTNDWDFKKTNYPMRIRFAPTKSGKWNCEVTLKVRQTLLNKSENISFNVVESNSKGFVSVHSNKRNLQRAGEIIFPVGNNFCAPDDEVVAYHNLKNPELEPDKLNKAATPNSWQIYLDRVEDYYKQGGKYIRTIQTPWSNAIEFEEKGNYFNRLHYAWEQDRLIELSEKYDGLILFNFMMQEAFMNFGDYYFYDWDWDHYNYFKEWDKNDRYPVYGYNDRPGKKQPHEMFLIEDDLKHHEQRTRYYVARYGYSTSIYEFEILSEPYHLDQFWSETNSQEPYLFPDHPLHKEVVRALNNYQNRISKYIKVDLDHKNQLVGINTTGPAWRPDGFIVLDSSLYSPHVDIIGMNPYSSAPNRYIISKSQKKGNNGFDDGENSYAKMINDYFVLFNKPIIISEGGPSENFLVCSDYSDIMIDNQSIQMMGFAGYHLWNGFRPHEIKLWTSILSSLKLSQNYLIPVFSQGDGKWVQGRQKSKLNRSDDTAIKETQYYIASNQSKAVGYVRNLTENYFTSKIDSVCNDPYYVPNNMAFKSKVNFKWTDGSKKDRLSIEGLQRKESYTVTWLSNGKEISKSTFKSSRKGTWILEYPDLIVTDPTKALPIVWFSIEKTQ